MLAELKPYLENQPAHPWLGAIPASWTLTTLGAITTRRSARNRSDLPLLSVLREKGVVLRSSLAEDENHNFIPDDLSNYRVALAGDLVVNKMKAWQGSVGIAPVDGIVSPAYFVFELFGITQPFAHRLFRSKPYVAFLGSSSDGVRIGQWDLSIDRMKRIPVPLPPTAEQAGIVRFLGAVDRKVNRFIRAKRRLVEVLTEQKQAIITHAVNKGLNPHAPLKPSGIDWLGDVPEHWEVVPLKRAARLQGGFAFPAGEFRDTGIAVIRMNNLRRGELNTLEAVRIRPEVCQARFALKAGDLLYGLSGSIGATGSLGNFARVTESDLPAQLNQRVGRFVVNPARLASEFLEMLIQGSAFYLQVLAETTGTAQFNVSPQDVDSVFAALPPLAEQQSILECVENETKAIDASIAAIKREIDLIREYRTRLVADVVTGKVDVRFHPWSSLEPVDAPDTVDGRDVAGPSTSDGSDDADEESIELQAEEEIST